MKYPEYKEMSSLPAFHFMGRVEVVVRLKNIVRN